MSVNATELELLESSEPHGKNLLDSQLRLIKNARVSVSAVVGDVEVTVNELYNLKTDSIVRLNQRIDEPISLMLDGRLIATGTLVAADDYFGVQITQIHAVD